jgi:hypothetical protein
LGYGGLWTQLFQFHLKPLQGGLKPEEELLSLVILGLYLYANLPQRSDILGEVELCFSGKPLCDVPEELPSYSLLDLGKSLSF